MCPLILNFLGPYSASIGSWGRRANLGLLAQPQQETPFPPPLCRFTTLPLYQGSFPFFCMLSMFLASTPFCHLCGLGPGPTHSQKMTPCTVAHLDQSLIFTVVKVIWFRIKQMVLHYCELWTCLCKGMGWGMNGMESSHTGLASEKQPCIHENVTLRSKDSGSHR